MYYYEPAKKDYWDYDYDPYKKDHDYCKRTTTTMSLAKRLLLP